MALGSRNRKLVANAAKACTVGAVASAVIALAAPMAFASHEKSWTHGCRGYWYSTTGHAYCKDASGGTYGVKYDCANQPDKSDSDFLDPGYRGKFSSAECRFDLRKTRVR